MIMMPYGCSWPSLQLTRHADLWHPTGVPAEVSDALGGRQGSRARAERAEHPGGHGKISR